MHISLLTALALAAHCAPSVAPETLLSIVQVESGFNPLVIGVNGPTRLTLAPESADDAVGKASSLIAAGRDIDLGLAQINSRNLGRLGLSIADAFDPCRSLAAAAQVLQAGYDRGGAETVGVQPALRTALSVYNTGSSVRGFANGYVTKVVRAAERIVPAIQPALGPDPAAMHGEPPPSHPPWDVFGQTSRGGAAFVVRISTPSNGAPN